MNTFADRLLESVDSVSSRIGAVNNIIDRVVSRFASKGTALAGCSGIYPECGGWCSTSTCYPDQCVDGQRTVYYVHMYSFTPSQYAQPCSAQCGECNDECGSYMVAC